MYAQEQTPKDSLQSLISNKGTHDTTIIQAKYELGELQQIYRIPYWDSIANSCEELLKKHKDEKVIKALLKSQAAAINNVGIVYSFSGNMEQTIAYFKKGVAINKKIGNQKGVAELLSNIGHIYNDHGEIVLAFDYLNEAIVVYDKIGDLKGVASCLNLIGGINFVQGEVKQALKDHERALKISREIKAKEQECGALSNIAWYMPNMVILIAWIPLKFV